MPTLAEIRRKHRQRVRAFITPPAGFRLLKLGEVIPDETLFWDEHLQEWRMVEQALGDTWDDHYAFMVIKEKDVHALS